MVSDTLSCIIQVSRSPIIQNWLKRCITLTCVEACWPSSDLQLHKDFSLIKGVDNRTAPDFPLLWGWIVMTFIWILTFLCMPKALDILTLHTARMCAIWLPFVFGFHLECRVCMSSKMKCYTSARCNIQLATCLHKHMVKMQIHLWPNGTGLGFTSHVQIKSAVRIKQKTMN